MSNYRNLPVSLGVYLSGQLVGTVERTHFGNSLCFTYDDSWLNSDVAISLSLSMPLTDHCYGHDVVYNWLFGLLSDNADIRMNIAERFDVSPNNPFAMLWAIGEDCPGAVQFMEIGRQPSLVDNGSVVWLDEYEIGERLAGLRAHASTARRLHEGQFSLSGAQPKTALIMLDGRWGVPSGNIPTTHILKPPIATLGGHAENEVFCQMLAGKAGLAAAAASVCRFADEIAIVVERYDRLMPDTYLPGDVSIVRIHQEDMCQALGYHPSRKYERDGGPGIKDIMDILCLSTQPEIDRTRFMEALAFNFLICGTDAHGRNYSILLSGDGAKRLAPLYDLASFLPYHDYLYQNLRMPMRIDKYYHFASIYPRHLERMCLACDYPFDQAMDIFARLSSQLPVLCTVCRDELDDVGIRHHVIDSLVERISWHCDEIQNRWELRCLNNDFVESGRV